MFSIASIKAFQIYGIAISMFVAVLIKKLVAVTRRVKPVTTVAEAPQKYAERPKTGISGEVVATNLHAITIVMGPHRILHITEI